MANNNYLLFIRQDDFLDLFKFGRLYTPGKCVEFDGDLDRLKFDKAKAEEIFDEVNDFEYSNDYFLLHVSLNKQLKRGVRFAFSDVAAIIALDESAYKLGLSLSPSVRITPPIWQEHYLLLQEKQMMEDAKTGINNISAIFDANFSKLKRKEGFPTHREDTTFSEVIHDTLNGLPIEGEHSIWYYLLRYERHQSYPDDNRGYLLDALHIYANFLKKTDIDSSLMRHSLGETLMKQPSDMTYGELCAFIPFTERIYQETEHLFNGFINIALLYLMMKEIFSEGLDPDKTYCNLYMDEFVQQIDSLFPGSEHIRDYALYLLGFSLGRANTYKYMYMTNRNKYRILS